ncbi:hypothetical protein V1J52_14920 [Streptomyces sp. TRM 70351]|nr:hypothetical protein [Streptomyces sp. TRM 70351]MEE1929459.1 hypothetical protein [Streptomyces sp. TRM 70351]
MLSNKLAGQRHAGRGAGGFVYFWPLYTAGELSMDQWRARMWLGTWI